MPQFLLYVFCRMTATVRPVMSNGILVVDDNASIRHLLVSFVECHTPFKVCGEARFSLARPDHAGYERHRDRIDSAVSRTASENNRVHPARHVLSKADRIEMLATHIKALMTPRTTAAMNTTDPAPSPAAKSGKRVN
jgi:hypothetical protein